METWVAQLGGRRPTFRFRSPLEIPNLWGGKLRRHAARWAFGFWRKCVWVTQISGFLKR